MSTSESDRIEPIETDEAEAEWQQFQQVEHMVNHWDRPGWTDDRRSYHLMLTFENAPEVRALAAACQSEFGDIESLDLVPLDYLHVTIQGLGFTDEVSFAEIEDITAAIESRAAHLRPFGVQVGPLAGSPGAVRLSVTPHEPVRAIHRMIAATASRKPGVPAIRTRSSDAYLPHASIAYSSSPAPAKPLIERVRSLRRLGFVSARIDSLHLVELRREPRAYRWNTIGSIALGRR
jgi:2'-5' RNA ligase